MAVGMAQQSVSMAEMMAVHTEKQQAYWQFNEDIDVLQLVGNIASENGYYQTPLKTTTVVRKDYVSVVMKFEHRKQDNQFIVLSFDTFNTVDHVRSMRVVTFAKDGQNVVQSITEAKPTHINDVKTMVQSLFEPNKMLPVAGRTSRRYMLSLITDTPVTDLA